MNRVTQTTSQIAACVMLIALGTGLGYWWANHSAKKPMENPHAPATATRKVLYWYDPMSPNQHFDKPGKSPFMDMELVPKYADAGAASNAGITVSPTVRQNLGIRLAPVEQRALNANIDVAGTMGFNERELVIVQARTGGFVSRVYDHAPGDVVARGAPLVDIVVPEWIAAQQEFLALRKSNDAALTAAARERLQLLGMSSDLIRRIETTSQPQNTLTIAAPISGAIQTLGVRNGMTIAAGNTLAQINALDSVWLTAAVPQSLGARINVGDNVAAIIAGVADENRDGRVIAVLPQTDSSNRTLNVRIEIANPHGQLRPGQFARVQLHSADTTPVIVAPSEALIRTGTRTVVIVADNNRFVPVQVQPGNEADGFTEIRSGLRPGQQVVISGQFLIDSEASLSGVMQQMQASDTQAGAP